MHLLERCATSRRTELRGELFQLMLGSWMLLCALLLVIGRESSGDIVHRWVTMADVLEGSSTKSRFQRSLQRLQLRDRKSVV